jgi:hypothetical protein
MFVRLWKEGEWRYRDKTVVQTGCNGPIIWIDAPSTNNTFFHSPYGSKLSPSWRSCSSFAADTYKYFHLRIRKRGYTDAWTKLKSKLQSIKQIMLKVFQAKRQPSQTWTSAKKWSYVWWCKIIFFLLKRFILSPKYLIAPHLVMYSRHHVLVKSLSHILSYWWQYVLTSSCFHGLTSSRSRKLTVTRLRGRTYSRPHELMASWTHILVKSHPHEITSLWTHVLVNSRPRGLTSLWTHVLMNSRPHVHMSSRPHCPVSFLLSWTHVPSWSWIDLLSRAIWGLFLWSQATSCNL